MLNVVEAAVLKYIESHPEVIEKLVVALVERLVEELTKKEK